MSRPEKYIQDDPGFLSQESCTHIVERVRSFTRGGGGTAIFVSSWTNGELRWARNRVNLGSDRRDVGVTIWREFSGNYGEGATNQLDDTSLEAVVRSAERRARENAPRQALQDNVLLPPELPRSTSLIWSNATAAVTNETRGAIARLLAEEAEAKGMLSAGYLEMRAGSFASWADTRSPGQFETHVPELDYDRLTQAQCSMTVRHPKGTGSGWAGLSSFDWTQIDGTALAARALEKCLASIDPVRIEPGRYTVILEPQAVCQMLESLLRGLNSYREEAAFHLDYDKALRIVRMKLGLQMIDERITISHDPNDPLLGVGRSRGLKPVTWITNGVLTALTDFDHQSARREKRILIGDLVRDSFRMSGGTTSVEEMIATTKRGLLVTRFSNLLLLDVASLLGTGITRDGLWLIENGVISKAVRNMRFTESPLFVLNRVEQLGVPVPVFRPVVSPHHIAVTPVIVPPMKANDFSFTSTSEAI